MDRKIRVGAVSYLNTKPFIYGLENGPVKDQIELVLDYPARLVSLLKNGEIDIGLVPVGALPGLGEYHIVSDYCIGSDGEVASVAVFSEVPMEKIETVYLDYQSRTSVLLCKLLFEKHWNKKVIFIEAQDEGYIDQIRGTCAGLIIGDRALMNRSRFPFVYDLGLGWKEMTSLPFVFAVWVSKSNIDPCIVDSLIRIDTTNIQNIKNVEDHIKISGFDPLHYFTVNIRYGLTDPMRKAIDLFLSYI